MAKLVYVVSCTKHGKDSGNAFRWAGKQVAVVRPKGKKQRYEGGCPMCKSDLLKEQNAA